MLQKGAAGQLDTQERLEEAQGEVGREKGRLHMLYHMSCVPTCKNIYNINDLNEG